VAHFLQKFGKELGKEVRGVSPEALALLEQYHWPGNIRELENVVERALVLGTGDMLSVESLPESVRRQRQPRGADLDLPEAGLDLDATLDQIERRLLERALERTKGVQTRAAELLHLSFRQFRYKLQKHTLGRSRDIPPDK
jgi:two-component system response regulator PilR (NtrC family)